MTCLGNNEPDGKPYLANWNGVSVGCYTKEEAIRVVEQLRSGGCNDQVSNEGT